MFHPGDSVNKGAWQGQVGGPMGQAGGPMGQSGDQGGARGTGCYPMVTTSHPYVPGYFGPRRVAY